MNKTQEALKLAIEAMQTCDLETGTWSYVDVALAIEACKAALAEQKPSEWISVNDRLPEESAGTCAVLIKSGEVLTAWPTYWHGSRSEFAEWTFPLDELKSKVTHWMPLPDAPTE